VIEIPTRLLRPFRTLLRMTCLPGVPRVPTPFVVCRAGKSGLSLSCQQGDVGLRRLLPGRCTAGAVALPATLLADLDRADGDTVALEQTDPTRGRATWREAGAHRDVAFDTVEPASLPEIAAGKDAVAMAAGFVPALAEAVKTTSRQVTRFALSRILLRGRTGQVIGTDGKQLLIQGGFPFPWSDDRLIPSVAAFAARELAKVGPIRLGQTDDRVTLEVGPWLFALRVEAAHRFPDVDAVIPKGGSPATTLRLDPGDVALLVKAVPNLAGHREDNAPVVLDLGRVVAVRTRCETDGDAEVVLSRSRVDGVPIRALLDRRFLLRAVRLGFSTFTVPGPNRPFLCRDEARAFLFMPLEWTDPAVIQAGGSNDNQPQPVRHEPEPERRPAVAASNGSQNQPRRDDDDPAGLLAEAEALRAALQDGLARASRLVAALRQQRKQTRALQAALASLRRLHPPDP